MTPSELLASLRDLDRALHSPRVTDHYRAQDARSRERFVGLRGWVAVALAEATRLRLEELGDALERNDAALRAGLREAQDALRRLDDAVRVLDVLADVLTVIAQVVPGVLDRAL